MALSPSQIDFLDQVVVRVVTERVALKGTEVAADFISLVLNPDSPINEEVLAHSMLVVDVGEYELPKRLEHLVSSGRLREVEYTDPTVPGRVKSIYFSNQCDIRVRG